MSNYNRIILPNHNDNFIDSIDEQYSKDINQLKYNAPGKSGKSDPRFYFKECLTNAAMTSSEPDICSLDKFDKEEDKLPQSHVVSSSGDAHVSSRLSSHGINSEAFNMKTATIPDNHVFSGEITDRQEYIKDLEKLIVEILEKPSPKCVQDKVLLVKYISCVKKLPPAIVLQALQKS